ncbi:NACHT, LRR and PYD domains-containing protein 3-like isoform X2 [Centroberyx gerrardi]
MGSQCSTLRRGKQREEECYKVPTTVHVENESPLFQRRPSLKKEGEAVEGRKEEETSWRREDGTSGEKNKKERVEEGKCWSEESSTLKDEHTAFKSNNLSPCHSETCAAASATTEEKEADWVDENRAQLIQSVTSVMPIADELLQRRVIHYELYCNIKAIRTSQDQMRDLYKALTSTGAKSAFYRILQQIQPEICEKEVIKELIKMHKACQREKFRYLFEGTADNPEDEKSLDKIYTELHIIQGESEQVNEEHEIWEIEERSRTQTTESTKINCNDIFNTAPGQDGREGRTIRTVMTKGIAGIGKTVSVKKFILDWAEGRANQDLDFIIVLPFRELNLVKDDPFSLQALLRDFHPELSNIAVAQMFANHKVLFIFDGLDESQLELDFSKTKRLTEVTKESSVDILLTNLIRKNLLPSALVWITSRPGAVHRIPRIYINQWTEVRGFNDPQKEEYFRKRVEDKKVAERIIKHITMSRSLYIMCHIPVFCWIAAKVLEHLLPKSDNSLEKSGNKEIPTTLTEMYTHFLLIQTQVADEKYQNNHQNQSDIERILMSSKEFILKLGRMAFEHLERSSVMFYEGDLSKYDIDIRKAGVYCGLCTEIFKEESVLYKKKVYCFVHLTIQEFFAALFVYHSYASKKIDSLSLKTFLLEGSEEELKSILDVDPVHLPLEELMEISIANSTLRKTGELDMFLRFLIGMSLASTQKLLQGLIQQTEDNSEVVEEIKTSLKEIDLADCSPERCLNLVHCLIELKDSSLHDAIQDYLKPNHGAETELSPVHCSALADTILMSNTPLDEFNLRKYRPSHNGVFRLLPAVRNCRKAVISGVWLNVWLSETISSALRMPNSVLTELHLTNNTFLDKGTQILTDGLRNPDCKLEALSLCGDGHSFSACQSLASALKSIISNLRELELSGNILKDSLQSVLSAGLGSPKLEKLRIVSCCPLICVFPRLNRNDDTTKICQELVSGFTSNSSHLRELDLSYSNLYNSEMKILSAGLMSTNCRLEALGLSHNNLNEEGCEKLASVLSSNPSHLRELDLSYNDLQDSGVKLLCTGLMSPHCQLKTLRLSFCKVTADGCASLASALRSDLCSLRELDLSFNHPADQGVKLLTERLEDSSCSLDKLNVDHNEECWFDLKLLRQYACDLTLDPNTAGTKLILSEENKKAECVREKQPYPDHPDRFDDQQVLCKEGLTGRHYWEAEYFAAGKIGVAYKSIARTGDNSEEYNLGQNEKSWCWTVKDIHRGSFYHNGSRIKFCRASSLEHKIGVYLDWPAGILSFYEVSSDTLTHLYSFHTIFTEPLHPGFSLESDGPMNLCKIKQPETLERT